MAESPVPGALREQLERWTAAGLIDSVQASLIEAAEQEHAAALPRRRLPLVAEVLGYLGAVIAVTAIVVAVHQIWKQVPAVAQLTVAGVIGVGLLLAGAALPTDRDPAFARLRSVLWVLSTAAVAAFVAVLTRRYLDLAGADVALAAEAAWLACAVPLWWWTKSTLEQVATFGGLVALIETGLGRIDPHAGSFASGIALWALALAWGIAVARGYLVPRLIGILLSGVGVLVGAIIAMDQPAGVALAVVTVAGLLAAGVLQHRVLLIGIGAIGTMYVIPDAAHRYLPGSVAPPLASAVIGLLLLGVALRLARHRRKEPTQPAANGHRDLGGRGRG